MDELETLCYIQEQTSFPEDYQGKFGYEPHESSRAGRFYLTFDAILQSFGVMNRNGRMYEANNIWDCIQTDETIRSYLSGNCWIGEIDHPASVLNGQSLTMNRIANIDKALSSHYIRRPRLNGNFLEATIQTDSSTEAGMNMAVKIVDGKIVPCFSARVLGALEQKNGKPTVHVRKLVTYDWVLYPSHREAQAKINQPVMESAKEMADAVNTTIIFLPQLAQMAMESDASKDWLCESFGITKENLIGVTETGNSVVASTPKATIITPITDRDIRKRTRSMVSDWLYS